MTKVKMPWIERAKFGIFVFLVAAVFFATLICVWILLVRFAVPAIDRLGWSGAVQFFINNAWQRFYALPLSSHVYVAGTFLGGTILLGLLALEAVFAALSRNLRDTRKEISEGLAALHQELREIHRDLGDIIKRG